MQEKLALKRGGFGRSEITLCGLPARRRRIFRVAVAVLILAHWLSNESRAVEPQYKWQQVTLNAAFAGRDGAGALVYDDKMWLLGGWHPGHPDFPKITNNEVWNSTNGLNWTLVKPNTFKDGVYNPATDWEGRHTAGYAVYDNKMWIIGGDANQGHYQSDVWNSTDGVNWTHVNNGNPAPWGPRVLQYTLAFDNKLWVIGGQTLPQFAPAADVFYRDIWNTTDGINWQQVQPQEPFWPQRGMIGGSVVFNDRMWILGGGTYDTPQMPQRKYFNDVWSSADGVNWTQHTANAPWAPRQYHDVAVWDNKLWVMAGYGGVNRDDVWYSADGVNWTEVPNTPWPARHAASVFVYDNALWVVAGSDSQPRNDVWKLTRTVVGGANSGTFEPTVFTLGPVVGQNGWIDFYFPGAGIEVVNTNVISGAQSLHAGSGTRAAASEVIEALPTSFSWLVRLDNHGGGNFETGIGTNPVSGITPITVIFGGDNRLKFYGPAGDTPFSGNPLYNAGVVYRVEVSINQAAGTWDVSIIDTGSNSLVGGGASLPILGGGLTDPRFFLLSRGGAGASSYVDEISLFTTLTGDFDGDGDVDGADFVIWQTHFPMASGAMQRDGDADADGDVDGADFVAWQTNFPNVPGSGAAPVTEPDTLWLLSLGGMAIVLLPGCKHVKETY